MNKYIKKIASWKNPTKFVGYVTGTRKRDAIKRYNHVMDFVGDTQKVGRTKAIFNVMGDMNSEKANTMKARIAAGAGVTGLVGGAALGYKKVRDKQKAETAEQYRLLFDKQASTGQAAIQVGRGVGSALGKALKRVGQTTLDMMNTAAGGKIKDYAHHQGINVGTKQFSEYSRGTLAKQLSILRAHQGITKPTSKKFQDHKFNLRNLHNDRRNARIALGSTAAAGVSAYGWKKARDAAKKEHPYY